MDEIKTLFALVANEVTDAMFISGIAAEDASPAWVATNYSIGDVVHVVATHRRYKDSVGGASAVAPNVDPSERWVDDGPTNKWAMFDSYVTTRTKVAGGTPMVFHPGLCNTIELRGVENANGITVTVKDAPGGNVLLNYVDDMEGSEPGDDWEYEYMAFRPRETVLITDFEPFSTAEVTITLTSDSGDVGVGKLGFGELRPLATTLGDAETRFADGSYIEVDKDTQESYIEKGPNARDLVLKGWLEAWEAPTVDRAIRDLLGTPASVYGSTEDRFEGLSTYGLVTARLLYPPGADQTGVFLHMEVEGLMK